MIGVNLTKPLDKFFRERSISSFVKPVMKDLKGKMCCVINGKNAYGVILVKDITSIDEKQFQKLSSSHRINDIQRKIWWGKKQKLYNYDFDYVKIFDSPLELEYKRGSYSFIENVFIGEQLNNSMSFLQFKELEIQDEKFLLGLNEEDISEFPSEFIRELDSIPESSRFIFHKHTFDQGSHLDLRLEIPSRNHLLGATINLSEIKDLNKETNTEILSLKPPHSLSFLDAEGDMEGREHGTGIENGNLSIAGSGTFKVLAADATRIALEFTSDDFIGGGYKLTIDGGKGFFSYLQEAELSQKDGNFTLTFSQCEDGCECSEVLMKKLVNFDNVRVFYSLSPEKSIIRKIEFGEGWCEDDVKKFLRRYGGRVISYNNKEKGTSELKLKRKKISVHLKKSIVVDLKKKEDEVQIPYEFSFVALCEGEFNGVFYKAEDLKEAVNTLTGKKITIDHGKSVKDIVGEIAEATYNPDKKRIEGKGIIKNKPIAEQIANGLLTDVSVEVFVDYENSAKTGLTAVDPEFDALSIVRKGACEPPFCGIVENIPDLEKQFEDN